jgi:uncharacterized protein
LKVIKILARGLLEAMGGIMEKPKIYRKRFIPNEIIDISEDELLFRDEELLITRWKTIRPREDIYGGVSYVFLKQGLKISKFFDAAGEFIYWYCDIIDIDYDAGSDTFVLIDLLLDLKLMPDGASMVLDTDELADALECGLVTGEQACRALRRLDSLLRMVYRGEFPPHACRDNLKA